MAKVRKTISRAEIITFLEQLVHALLDQVGEIAFNKEHPQQLFIMCLYGRMLELAVTINNLMKANDDVGVPILLRSQMEAFVDFANLINDREFIHVILATFLDQKNRLYNNLSKHLDVSTLEKPLDSATAAIATAGKKPKSIWARFKDVNLEKTYISAYFILCDYAHNNLAMLEHRHIEKDGADHRVIFFKEEPFDAFIRFSMTMGAMLVDAQKMLTDFFNVSPSEQVEALHSRFTGIRKEVKEALSKSK